MSSRCEPANIESGVRTPALVSAFLLASYRGWRGAAVAIAGGMAVLAAAHATALGLGRMLPDTTVALTLVGVCLAVVLRVGWTTELLHVPDGVPCE